jgi:ABC-2 type transport system permease protein
MSFSQRLVTLIKRELQEHRKSALYAPIIVAIFIVLMLVVSLISNGAFKVNNLALSAKTLERLLAQGPEKLALIHESMLLGFFVIFHVACGIVIWVYCLSSLFDERKDRSTLFWRSMPVRDWESVLSKALMATVVIPSIFLVAIAIVQIALYGLLILIAWQHKLDATTLIWQPMQLGRISFLQALTMFASKLWALPVIGWFLLCSAYAKQRPMLLAIVVPGLAILAGYLINLQNLVLYVFGAEDSMQAAFKGIGGRFLGLLFPTHYDFNKSLDIEKLEGSILNLHSILSPLWSVPGLIGIAIGCAFIAAAAWVRRYREDAAA